MKNRFISIALAMSMGFTLISCGSNSTKETSTETNDESTEDSYCYNISALLSDDNTNNQILLQGFTDCLTDYLGEDHFTITTTSPTEEASTESIAASAVSSNPDMIFTAGNSTLTSAADLTDTIPIIATGIIDFKGTLHIASLNGKSWDKTTGRNITGISSKPSIVDQVSLMIEATDDLQTVGIFFSPEDTDAIYQNEIFESYLDQAGIPWKEYLIPVSSDEEETTSEDEEEKISTALSASKYVAISAKTGMDNQVEILGEGTNPGLNSTSSTRVALVSEFWTGGKTVYSSDESNSDEEDSDSEDSSSEDSTNKSTSAKSSDEEESEELTLETSVAEACSECSAIYIPYGSMLTDQMEIIGSIATDNKVTVVAGDTEIGQNSLVTLFMDPYSLGYAAGKKAVRVFNGEDITAIKIGYGDADDSVKLYNGEIAEEFGMEFPKSFSELTEFLSTYEYGSNTTRYSAAVE